jgi:hypothetical protein
MRRYNREDYEGYTKSIVREGRQEVEEHQERTQSQSLRRAWLADGGSEADFEKAWPVLRNEGRRQRVVGPPCGTAGAVLKNCARTLASSRSTCESFPTSCMEGIKPFVTIRIRRSTRSVRG